MLTIQTLKELDTQIESAADAKEYDKRYVFLLDIQKRELARAGLNRKSVVKRIRSEPALNHVSIIFSNPDNHDHSIFVSFKEIFQ